MEKTNMDDENKLYTRKLDVQKEFERRKKAEKDAHIIVENLLQNNISKQMFLHSLKKITPDHYADITEERSISGNCGYCLCNKNISQMPSQQFKISRNRVYDITERKKFCSDSCFSISSKISKQIPSSPIWLRDIAKMSDIKLPECISESERLPGEEVALRNIVSLDDVESHIDEGESDELENITKEKLTNEIIEKSNIRESRSQASKSVTRSTQSRYLEALSILNDWITKATLQYLQLLPKECIDEQTKSQSSNSIGKENHIQSRFTSSTDTERVSPPRQCEPQGNEKEFLDKVASYFKSSLVIQERTVPKHNKNTEPAQKNKSELVLPTVDTANQEKVRQKIVQEHLNKMLKNLSLPIISASIPDISFNIHQITKTFRLTSKNTMLSFDIWPVMTIMILHVLSVANMTLKKSLKSDETDLFLSTLLKPYEVDTVTLRKSVAATVNDAASRLRIVQS